MELRVEGRRDSSKNGKLPSGEVGATFSRFRRPHANPPLSLERSGEKNENNEIEGSSGGVQVIKKKVTLN